MCFDTANRIRLFLENFAKKRGLNEDKIMKKIVNWVIGLKGSRSKAIGEEKNGLKIILSRIKESEGIFT